MGCKLFHSQTVKYGQIHHNLRINFNIHHEVLHELFIHHAALNQFSVHHAVLNQFFTIFWLLFPVFHIRHDLLITFPNFPLEGVETCQILNQFI